MWRSILNLGVSRKEEENLSKNDSTCYQKNQARETTPTKN
jgi:hypothetical protein